MRLTPYTWCFTLILLGIVQLSRQDNVQPNNQELMQAILKLENLFEDKLTALLEEKMADVQFRLNQIDMNIVGVKSNVKRIDTNIVGVKSDLSVVKGTVESMEADWGALGERSSLTLTAAEKGKVLQEQVITKLNDIKENEIVATENGKLMHEKTLTELNDFKVNITEQFQKVDDKVVHIEENLSETINDIKINLTGQFQKVTDKVVNIAENLSETINETTSELQNKFQELHDATSDEIKDTVASFQKSHQTTVQELNESVDELKNSCNNSTQGILENHEKIRKTIEEVKNSYDNSTQGILETHDKIQKTIEELKNSSDISMQKMQEAHEIIQDSIEDFQNSHDAYVKQIIYHVGCPEGFLNLKDKGASRQQCFKLINDTTRTWDEATEKCKGMGLRLAKPTEAIAAPLAQFIVDTYGKTYVTWLSARGDGSVFKWERDNEVINSNNTLWKRDHPNTRVTTDHCLVLDVRDNLEQPYYSWSGCKGNYALCEAIGH